MQVDSGIGAVGRGVQGVLELTDLVARERVLIGLRPGGKRQLLQELANEAGAACGLDPKLVLELLIQREKLGTTAVGDGIAIPHAKVPGLSKLVGFFARLARPVDFDALDDRPVDLVFVLLAPENAGADHLKALARIARVLRDPALCAQLRQAPDPRRAFALLTGGPESHAA
jgi:PTS system nitrogen regulatory IIA component